MPPGTRMPERHKALTNQWRKTQQKTRPRKKYRANDETPGEKKTKRNTIVTLNLRLRMLLKYYDSAMG